MLRATAVWSRTAHADEIPQRSPLGGRIYNLVGEWRSSEAHLAGGQGVAGSNPASPTKSCRGCAGPMSPSARRAGAAAQSIGLGSTSEEDRVCIRCHVEQPITQFTLRGSRRELVCRKCRAHRQRLYRDSLSAERRTLDRHGMRGWRFGLSPKVVAAMLADQHGRCAICSVELTSGRKGSERACLDHDHQSGKPRAFLCGSCNSKLGHFETVQAYPESISRALAAYLEKFRSRPGRE